MFVNIFIYLFFYLFELYHIKYYFSIFKLKFLIDKNLANEFFNLEEMFEEALRLTVQQEVDRLDEKVENEFNKLRSDFNTEIKPINEDLGTLKTAMQKDIRRSIRQDGKLLIDRGWATQQEKTEFDELYWAYHNLGKNGVVDALHDQVMHLPEKRPYQPTKQRKNKQNSNDDKK